MDTLQPDHYWKTPFFLEPGRAAVPATSALTFETVPDDWLLDAVAQVMAKSAWRGRSRVRRRASATGQRHCHRSRACAVQVGCREVPADTCPWHHRTREQRFSKSPRAI